MRYFIRSIKYFFYFSFLCFVIVAALVLIGAVDGDINAIFQDGYKSVVKIFIFFALVAAVYPKVGFISRDITTEKEWGEIRETVLDYLEEHRYILEHETDDVITFRFKGTIGRLSKKYEDRLTLTKCDGGYTLEGLRKDVMILSMGIEYRINPQTEV